MVKSERNPVKGPKILFLGGGSGPRPLLEGAKYYHNQGLIDNPDFGVAMLDSGGSSRIIRKILNTQAPGDAAQGIVALSNTPDFLQKLMDYRLDFKNYHGDESVNIEGLQGHTIRNLLLVAGIAITGSMAGSIEGVSSAFDTVGRVIPATHDDLHLVITTRDNKIIHGEHEIDTSKIASLEGAEVWYTDISPEEAKEQGITTPPNVLANISPQLEAAIKGSDITVLAPGSVITSHSQILRLRGFKEAAKETEFMLVSNMATGEYHTRGMTVGSQARETERLVGGKVLSAVLYNTGLPPKKVLKLYADEGEFMMPEGDLDSHYKAKGMDLVSLELAPLRPGEKLPRNYIRHDGIVTVGAILNYLENGWN